MADNANSGIARGEVIHGARGYITLEGKRLAYCQSINANLQKNVLDVECLDDLLTTEHITAAVTVSGAIGVIDVYATSLVERGLTAPIEGIFARVPLGLAIVDRPNAKVWRAIRGLTFTGYSFSLQKGVFTASQVQFKAIMMVDKDGITDV